MVVWNFSSNFSWHISSIFLLFGQSPTIVALAKPYLHAVAWALFPNFIMIASLELLLGLGHGLNLLFFNLLSVLLSISFSFILIFGKLGLPALGIAGAGWGVVASSCVMVLILASFIGMHPNYRAYFLPFKSTLSFHVLMELIKIGLPIGAMFFLEVAFFLVLLLVTGALGGPTALAANQIALQYMCLLMSIIFSIAQAMTVRMGHLLGGNNPLAAKRAAFCGVATAGGFMGLVAIFFWVCPIPLIALDFNPHQVETVAVVVMIIALFKVSSLFQIVEAIRIAWFGALRSLKDTLFPLLSTLIGFWAIPLPIGYVLAHYTSIGVVGFWWGFVAL